MTLRQFIRITRQLHYHRKRIDWMKQKMEENERAIISELIARGKEKLAVGGFLVRLKEESEVVIEKLPPIAFDQPALPIDFAQGKPLEREAEQRSVVRV